MTIDTCLRAATHTLENTSSTARLDCEVLLAYILRKDRAWVLAHAEYEVTSQQASKFTKLIKRRAAHEPIAYITGVCEFYGREFLVSADTLQPRPETETMVDLFKALDLPHKSLVADIGTGSGAIAITIKLEQPGFEVIGTEINTKSLKIAKKNQERLCADITLIEGNLFDPIKNLSPVVILANLPYVPDSHTINEAAMFEPKIAIFGGEDGLDLYRRLFQQIPKSTKYVFTESLPFQHESLSLIAKKSGYKLVRSEDFIQQFEKL